MMVCSTCQRFKPENVSSSGLLQPLPSHTSFFSDISMDFIEGLPFSKGKSMIFVVVDRLTKCAHFVPMSHPFTARVVAQILWITSINYMVFHLLLLVTEIHS